MCIWRDQGGWVGGSGRWGWWRLTPARLNFLGILPKGGSGGKVEGARLEEDPSSLHHFHRFLNGEKIPNAHSFLQNEPKGGGAAVLNPYKSARLDGPRYQGYNPLFIDAPNAALYFHAAALHT